MYIEILQDHLGFSLFVLCFSFNPCPRLENCLKELVLTSADLPVVLVPSIKLGCWLVLLNSLYTTEVTKKTIFKVPEE